MPTHEKVSIGGVKRDISDLVNRVAYGGERIILTSRGKPKAALVSIDDLERLRQTEEPDRLPLSQIDSLVDLVAAIRRLPPGRNTYEPPRGSSAAVLARQPADPSFDLETWQAEWARVEAEMKRVEAEDVARDEHDPLLAR